MDQDPNLPHIVFTLARAAERLAGVIVEVTKENAILRAERDEAREAAENMRAELDGHREALRFFRNE